MDNHHGIKPWKSGVTACEELCRYVDLASQIDITMQHASSVFVGARLDGLLAPPA